METPKKYDKISAEQKKLIIELDGSGLTITSIASMPGCKPKSVQSFMRRYKVDGKIERPRTHRAKILKAEHIDKLREWLEDNCQLTLVELSDKLEDCFGIKVCTTTIRNYLKKELFFSLKRVSLVPVARNSEANIERRYSYAAEFSALMASTATFPLSGSHFPPVYLEVINSLLRLHPFSVLLHLLSV